SSMGAAGGLLLVVVADFGLAGFAAEAAACLIVRSASIFFRSLNGLKLTGFSIGFVTPGRDFFFFAIGMQTRSVSRYRDNYGAAERGAKQSRGFIRGRVAARSAAIN